jgi:hypothetical protein
MKLVCEDTARMLHAFSDAAVLIGVVHWYLMGYLLRDLFHNFTDVDRRPVAHAGFPIDGGDPPDIYYGSEP